MAIFVEGQTEQMLVEKIIENFFHEKNFLIFKKHRGSKCAKEILEIRTKKSIKNTEYFFLIVDCGADNKVKSDIVELQENLADSGYCKVIGIRDVSPQKYSEIEKLRKGLYYKISTKISVKFILSIMEVEAWLMAEHNHFSKMHPKISVKRIKDKLGLDLIKDDLSQRERPSDDLKAIYLLENIFYDKSKKMVEKILLSLNFHQFKNSVGNKFPDLGNFYKEIDLFASDTVK